MSNAEPLTPPTSQSESSAAVPGASGRLICLDIFRGLAVAGMILVDNPGSDEKVYRPIAHAEWNGWTPADFIFPSFLFLVGVSLVFSFAKRRERGDSRGQLLLHVFIRSLLLIVIGLLVNASPFIGVDFHALRFEGVTQRIALCYFAAAILELWSDRRGTNHRHRCLPARILGASAVRSGAGPRRPWPRHSVHGPQSKPGGVAGPQTFHGASFRRHARPGGNSQHHPGYRDYFARSADGPLVTFAEDPRQRKRKRCCSQEFAAWSPVKSGTFGFRSTRISGRVRSYFSAGASHWFFSRCCIGCWKSSAGAAFGPFPFLSLE